MARINHTPEQLDSIAGELELAAKSLRAVASSIRDSGMPSALIHSATVKSVHLPQVHDWIGKTKADSESQIRAYLAGLQSKAELHKQQAEQKKSAAAKKPAKGKRSS